MATRRSKPILKNIGGSKGFGVGCQNFFGGGIAAEKGWQLSISHPQTIPCQPLANRRRMHCAEMDPNTLACELQACCVLTILLWNHLGL